MISIAVLPVKELWEGEMTSLQVRGKRVLLIHYQGQIFAHFDRCPHQGVPLSQGCLREGILKCRAHGWEFEASGAGHNPRSVSLNRIPARVENGMICVELEEEVAHV